jgi:hypothetical protein
MRNSESEARRAQQSKKILRKDLRSWIEQGQFTKV